MEEDDASFETDTDGTVQLGEPGSPNVRTPGGRGNTRIEKESKTTIVEFNWDSGGDKGESRTEGSGKIEVDSPDPPSTGDNPTQKGEPLTGEAEDDLNGSGGSGGSSSGQSSPRVRGDRDGQQTSRLGRRVYNDIGELEKEIEDERKNIGKIVENVVQKGKEQQAALQGKVNQAGLDHNELARRTFGSLPSINLPLPPGAGSPPSSNLGKKPKTPPNAPLGQRVRRSYFHLEFTKANAPAQSKPLVDVAEETFDKADQLCSIGDLENGKQALDTVDALTQAALSPEQQPSPPGSSAPQGSDLATEQRSNAQNTALELCRAANNLNNAGFPNLASSLRITAGDLLNFGLGLARSAKLIDLPLSLVEGFAGKTIQFTETGELVVSDATTTERIFAVLDVALTIGALASGGLPALLGAGVLSQLDKDIVKKLEKLVEGFKDKARRGESFDISEFPGYSDRVPKPTGSPRVLVGEEYKRARKEANRANKPLRVKGKEVHEILPVKFGGSPTDPTNKIILSKADHIEISIWWRTLQRLIEGK